VTRVKAPSGPNVPASPPVGFTVFKVESAGGESAMRIVLVGADFEENLGVGMIAAVA